MTYIETHVHPEYGPPVLNTAGSAYEPHTSYKPSWPDGKDFIVPVEQSSFHGVVTITLLS